MLNLMTVTSASVSLDGFDYAQASSIKMTGTNRLTEFLQTMSNTASGVGTLA